MPPLSSSRWLRLGGSARLVLRGFALRAAHLRMRLSRAMALHDALSFALVRQRQCAVPSTIT
ncbi:hypothetical protein RHECNPAF_6420029 [Rhizobium etli CNPAF512]|nr:hypothetical protein RHECNPAF_6420029 [Rhizobium etli CNPAF512]